MKQRLKHTHQEITQKIKPLQESFVNLITEPVIRVFAILIVTGIILSLVYYASLFNRKVNDLHTISGRIVEVNQNHIEVKNRKNRIANITITPETKIKVESNPNDTNLDVGMFVLVTGYILSPGEIEAIYIQEIKTLGKPNKND